MTLHGARWRAKYGTGDMSKDHDDLERRFSTQG